MDNQNQPSFQPSAQQPVNPPVQPTIQQPVQPSNQPVYQGQPQFVQPPQDYAQNGFIGGYPGGPYNQPPIKPKRNGFLMPLIIILVCISLVAGACAIGFNALSGGSAKSVAEKYTKAIAVFDYDAADKYSLFSLEDFYEQAFHMDIYAVKDLTESFEKQYGDIDEAEIKIKSVKVKDMKNSQFKKIKRICKNDDLDFSVNANRIKPGKTVRVKYRIKGEKHNSTTRVITLHLVKYNFKWKVVEDGLISTYNVYAKLDDDDDDDDDDDYYFDDDDDDDYYFEDDDDDDYYFEDDDDYYWSY